MKINVSWSNSFTSSDSSIFVSVYDKMKLNKWYSYSFKSCIMCYTMPISIRMRLFKTLMLKIVRERMV